MDSGQNLITMEKVGFYYGEDGKSKKALNNISLSIKKGEIYLICGRSGCGKTTLLRHMKKSLIPFGMGTGSIKYKGASIFEMSDRESAEKIGYVSQNPEQQIVTDKVWHELVFGMESLGADVSTMEARSAETAQYFGIEDRYEALTDNLSGGQKQILNLAAAMSGNPEILLLDEPASQLDPVGAGRFFQMLLKINRELGTTIVMTEQRLEEAWHMADKVIVMEKGEILVMREPVACADELFKIHKKGKSFGVWEGLPASLRLYYGLEGKADGKAPLTVREGRDFLYNYLSKRDVFFTDMQENHGRGVGIKTFLGKKPRTFFTAEKKKEGGFSENEVVLSAKGVYFGYEKKENILKDFDFKAKKGEIIGILGGNGVGKTTALKVLAGIYTVKKGKASIKGKLCYLPQDVVSMFTEMTAWEELWEAGASKEETERVADFLNLSDLLTQNPYDLSGGEAERLALGKLLLRKPDILLMDEPTKGLDAEFKKALGMTMKELSSKGMTIVMVSHDVEFTAEYAGSCALMFGGRLTAYGDTHSFFTNFNLYTTRARLISRGILPEEEAFNALDVGESGKCGCITIEELVEEVRFLEDEKNN